MDDTNEAKAKQKEESSLNEQFQFCERVIDDNDSGAFSTKEMQARLKECKEKLENLTREVSARELFSKNETVDELPTSSLQYLLLPSYLATTIQNIIVEPEHRVEALDNAKVYLRDFLERLLSYEVIAFSLPWLEEEEDEEDVRTKMKSKPDAGQVRANKVRRREQQKQMEANLENLKLERSCNADDDSVLRELLMARLQLFALKAVNELEQIDEERPLAEHMVKVRAGQVSPRPVKAETSSRPPIIITRDATQKKVFGLGYPSIPTVTVDEWFDDMVKHGRFGTMQKRPSNEQKPSESEEDDETAEEEKRAKAQRWDEYKDMHRRGWGNTQNKG
ncbi:Immunoglobulin-binding protein 1 [Toxocara canis]|uniref:Immunoglobulin-binding protein 1 n=1 Tax=Toxocara canis TaxID=6265 RepID=A0A0B2VJL5_TOXCA|nr:Immunoglobulin-binding protein 1 [Toxocara canis]